MAEQGSGGRLNKMPSLTVTSPYLCTQQTAAAIIERSPAVPVEGLAIQEFTYFKPSRWNGTRSSERMPVIEKYWGDADPKFATAREPRASAHCSKGHRQLQTDWKP
ncbi:hypothetical protein [Terriglobus sp.]|uniref:hypothetical protein n=1 Tax=Terriglobus sp. TaxID=1889013 RepID=UPI003B005C2B